MTKISAFLPPRVSNIFQTTAARVGDIAAAAAADSVGRKLLRKTRHFHFFSGRIKKREYPVLRKAVFRLFFPSVLLRGKQLQIRRRAEDSEKRGFVALTTTVVTAQKSDETDNDDSE